MISCKVHDDGWGRFAEGIVAAGYAGNPQSQKPSQYGGTSNQLVLVDFDSSVSRGNSNGEIFVDDPNLSD